MEAVRQSWRNKGRQVDLSGQEKQTGKTGSQERKNLDSEASMEVRDQMRQYGCCIFVRHTP